MRSWLTVVALSSLVFGCSGSPSSPSEAGGSMTGTLDGQPFRATEARAHGYQSNLYTAAIINARDCRSGYGIQLLIGGLGTAFTTGTYRLGAGVGTDHSARLTSLSSSPSYLQHGADWMGGKGIVTITEASTDLVAGSFSVEAVPIGNASGVHTMSGEFRIRIVSQDEGERGIFC